MIHVTVLLWHLKLYFSAMTSLKHMVLWPQICIAFKLQCHTIAVSSCHFLSEVRMFFYRLQIFMSFTGNSTGLSSSLVNVERLQVWHQLKIAAGTNTSYFSWELKSCYLLTYSCSQDSVMQSFIAQEVTGYSPKMGFMSWLLLHTCFGMHHPSKMHHFFPWIKKIEARNSKLVFVRLPVKPHITDYLNTFTNKNIFFSENTAARIEVVYSQELLFQLNIRTVHSWVSVRNLVNKRSQITIFQDEGEGGRSIDA